MTTYSDIQALHEAGDSPAAIVAKLQHVTPRDIDLGQLMAMLNHSGMLSRLPFPDSTTQSKWTGTVINMMNAILIGGTEEQKSLVTQWFSHITNDRNVSFHTTNPEFAGAVQSLKAGFAGQPGMPSAGDFDAIFALGGGQPHKELTEARVNELISENAASVQRQDWQTRLDAALNTFGTSEQTGGIADIRAVATEMETA